LLEDHGSSSAEFAIVAPVAISLILGSLGLSMLLWTSSSLHAAVEAAARCYAIGAAHSNTTACSTTANAVTYATSKYAGPNLSPVFTAAATGCGHTVTGDVTFPLNTGLINLSIPLKASSCFP